MRKIIICCAILALLNVSAAFGQDLAKRLNGIWANNIFTVEIDFDKGTYNGVAMGKPFEHKLSFVKEMGNVVYFKSDNTLIVAQLQEDGNLMLTKEGGVPMLVKKTK